MSSPSSAPPPSNPRTTTMDAATRAQLLKGYSLRRKPIAKKTKKPNTLLVAGLPFMLFSVLGAWVVSNAVAGRLKEREASQGVASQSLRQAALQQEHDDMMEKLNKIVEKDDFDNTKRIKRPEEILEERRQEREKRNAWYRRAYRWILREE